MASSNETSLYILSPPSEDVCQSQLRLLDAASQAGDVDKLYAVLKQNPFILEAIDRIPFVNTPLHIAVKHEQAYFVAEITKLKPSLTRKLNENGFSPLHLASENDHWKIAIDLMKVDNDLCLLKGKGNMTPLHCATMAGSINVMRELLLVCPKSIGELTIRHETALHLAVKNEKLEALKLLVKILLKHRMNELVISEEDEGNTAMQLSQTSDQPQMVQVLRGVSPYNISNDLKKFIRVGRDRHDALLVVAVLIATATFQLGVNPPGGLWQDNYVPNQNISTNANNSTEKRHFIGTAILVTRSKLYFCSLIFCNTGTFLLSLCMIYCLIRSPVLVLILACLYYTYFMSIMGYSIPKKCYRYAGPRCQILNSHCHFTNPGFIFDPHRHLDNRSATKDVDTKDVENFFGGEQSDSVVLFLNSIFGVNRES